MNAVIFHFHKMMGGSAVKNLKLAIKQNKAGLMKVFVAHLFFSFLLSMCLFLSLRHLNFGVKIW